MCGTSSGDGAGAKTPGAAERLDDLVGGGLQIRQDQDCRDLQSRGMSAPQNWRRAIKEKISNTAVPDPVFDFQSNGTGSLTMYLYSKPTVRHFQWKVNADHGAEADLHFTPQAAAGRKGERAVRPDGEVFRARLDGRRKWMNWRIRRSKPRSWVHRTPRHDVEEFAADPGPNHAGRSDEEIKVLSTVKDATTRRGGPRRKWPSCPR